MPFMVWNESYKIGVPEMDEQHQRWLALLNEFYDHVKEGASSENLTKLLKGAMDYTDFHFAEEERFMGSIGYPGIDQQRARHQDIRNHLQEYYRKLQDRKVVISLPVTTEMKNWFNQHILVEDKQYAEFVHRGR